MDENRKQPKQPETDVSSAQVLTQEPHLVIENLPDIADWLVQNMAAGIVGGAAFAAAQSLLSRFKQKFGSTKVKELNEAVNKEIANAGKNPDVSGEEIQDRIRALFAEFE